jgi:hypothetical protein
MKKVGFIIVLLGLSSLRALAQADTIGFWKIQYDSKEISPVTVNSEQTYFISAISDTSKLDIFYYTESPCKKCECKLEFRDENGNTIKTMDRKGYGDNRPFQLQGKELSAQLSKGRVYVYFSGKYDGWLPWVFMGALRLKQ